MNLPVLQMSDITTLQKGRGKKQHTTSNFGKQDFDCVYCEAKDKMNYTQIHSSKEVWVSNSRNNLLHIKMEQIPGYQKNVYT